MSIVFEYALQLEYIIPTKYEEISNKLARINLGYTYTMPSYLKHPGTEQNFCLGMSTAQSTEIKIFPDYIKPHLKPTTKSLFHKKKKISIYSSHAADYHNIAAKYLIIF